MEVKKFDYAKLVESRQAYIGRIHTSYNNVLAKNNVDVLMVLRVLKMRKRLK